MLTDVQSYLKGKDALFNDFPVSECTLPDILNCNNAITRLQKIEENDYDLLGRI